MNRTVLITVIALVASAPLVSPVFAQEVANPTEFTLTDFTDAARGVSFKRPTSWTQDLGFKDGVRFAGGDEWLSLQVIDSKGTPQQYTSSLSVPSSETKIGIKPFKQGTFSASVYSTSASGKSSVTGKTTELLIDRWVFSPKLGKLAVLTVAGPKRVFDWEGNRDMALSVRVK